MCMEELVRQSRPTVCQVYTASLARSALGNGNREHTSLGIRDVEPHEEATQGVHDTPTHLHLKNDTVGPESDRHDEILLS